MRAIVTGGAGFIGSHLVDKLIDRGDEVTIVDNFSHGKRTNINPKATVIDADIRTADLDSIVSKASPEVIFHLAAQIDVRSSVEDPINGSRKPHAGTACARLCTPPVAEPSTAGPSSLSARRWFRSQNRLTRRRNMREKST